MADDENNNNNNRVVNAQADNRVLLDTSMPGLGGTQCSIARPSINSNNFEIKPSLIQIIQNTVQFFGMTKEDPNDHIAEFLELCDTIKMNGVTEDVLKQRLFPFSLKDKAKIWLESGSFTTWDDLTIESPQIYRYIDGQLYTTSQVVTFDGSIPHDTGVLKNTIIKEFLYIE